MKYFCVSGIFFALIWLTCGSGYAVEKDVSQVPTVTISLLNVRMDEVVKDVSEQVDYTIQVEGKLKESIVSGRYRDVLLDEFFHRILRGKNIVVDMDTRKRKVIVYLFGSSLGREYAKFQTDDGLDAKLPLTNVSLSEMDEIFAKEELIHQGWREDPDAVMPFTSVTNDVFVKTVNQEATDEQERKLDPERKVALSDVTHSEAILIMEREGWEEKARRQNPNEKIALSRMTQSEYKAMVDGEVENSRQEIEQDAFLPFSNVTTSEFHAMFAE